MNADKKQIWVNGQFVEVTEEVYAAYTQGDRKIRYFETDLKVERTVLNKNGTIKQVIPSREDSLDRLMDDNAKQFSDEQESVEEIIFHKITVEALYAALAELSAEDYRLITSLYFQGRTIRDCAAELGVYPNAVHKRKIRILKKLKEILK